MSARQSCGWAAAGLFASLALFGACSSSSTSELETQADRPPNVLLISLDTLRADRLGCYGYERPTSPTLDGIAAQGARFLDVSSPASKTATSHMSMLTGMHPTVHGVRNCYKPETQAVNPKLPLLAEFFQDAGYRTAAFTGGGMMTHELGFDRGFESYEDAGGGADKVFPKAEAWLAEYASTEGPKADPRPFFLFVHTYEIHDPYTPPVEWQTRFVKDYQGQIDSTRVGLPDNAAEIWKTDPGFYEAIQERFWGKFEGNVPSDVAHVSDLYDAGIAYTDDLLAGLFATLSRLGLEDENLLVVITSDHGDEFSEHGQMTHQTLYQGILHVPLIVRWPGHVPAGRTPAQPVQGADLAPSILELVGLTPASPAPSETAGASDFVPMQGRSWAASLNEDLVPWDVAWSEIGTPDNEEASLRWGRYKLIGNRISRKAMLFDLEMDPRETFDGIENFRDLGALLGARMESIEAENRALEPRFPTTTVTLGDAAKGALGALGYTDEGGK
jgi:arylsulfatase A-like enzyme